MLQIGDDYLPESGAACFYLAQGSALIPGDRYGRADMLRWMFWEQYHHEPNIATLRFWRKFVGEEALDAVQRDQLAGKQIAGEAALALMEVHLEHTDFFVGPVLTLADIALYAYTHVAAEGGFTLDRYPAVTAWLDRVAATPGHIAMAD